MRELLYDGFGVNKQYTPPDTSPLYYEKLAKAYLEYDPDKANALLDGLGISQRDAEGFRLWNDGSGQRVAFTALGQEPEVGEELLMVTDYLKDVGIQVNYRGVDRALAIEMTNANEVEMTLSVADCNLVPLADPQFYLKNAEPDSQAWCEAWTLWYLDPTNPNAEKPPEGHWIWTLWGIWEELQKTVGEDKQKELMWKIMDVWVDELPAPGLYGDLPMPIVVKNGFKGIKEGYDWDCCITIYEYIIDCSTWYWDDPAKHV
jgi:peptide/nickel transport system substrate-binding protein